MDFDFLSGAIVSGVMYDYFKEGITLSARKIKEFFQENLYELPDEQARLIFAKSQDIPTSPLSISKEDFISQYANYFELNTADNSTNQTNIGNNNTNIVANNSPITFNQHIQKKTEN
ncbi:hypothetical protein IM753_02580 [Moraxella sp. K127]|uniref:hypothetical protein n=1 Tax=Moraxella TaxID=475 RepID=UPI0018801DE5|nr:hypothetical protein [Moraxella sp. K127]MBE9589877.1 hypothetical protein [Moraxella sp. K127]